jgi:hypothetical protein
MDLTIWSKTLATTFFVSDVQGSYTLIHGHNCFHANQRVPSSLYQFLVYWVGVDATIIHVDSLFVLPWLMLLHLGGMIVLPAYLVMTY